MNDSRRRATAILAAALFACAQTSAFCQNFPPLPKTVVAKEAAFVVGAAQQIAPANADTVSLSTQGRYALIVQHEATLPPGPLIGQPTTGAAAVLLYDVRSGKTRTLWQRRADAGDYRIDAHWLPETNIVLISTNADPRLGSADSFVSIRLLLVNVDKGLAPQVIAEAKPPSPGMGLSVSPRHPFFVVQQDGRLIFGGAQGVFNSAVPLLPGVSLSSWNSDGTAVYLEQTLTVPADKKETDAKPKQKTVWFEWNGKGSPTPLSQPPDLYGYVNAAFLHRLPLYVSRGGAISVPAEEPPVPRPPRRPKNAPQNAVAPPPAPVKPALPKAPREPAAVLHPLFLEAQRESESDDRAENPSWSVLVAPDADAGYVLSDGRDSHAVLYTSGGALYAAPIIRLKPDAYAEVQKAFAVRKAKQVGLAILQYTQDYDDEFPRQSDATEVILPYLKDTSLTRGFVFVRPTGPIGSVPAPAALVMGYIAGPGGRAVVYVDGHAEWKAGP